MTLSMEQFVEGWLLDPTVGKLVAATVAILIVAALVRLSRRVLSRYVQEPGNLYRAKKMVTFLGYFTGLIILSLIFSDTASERWPWSSALPAQESRSPCRKSLLVLRDGSPSHSEIFPIRAIAFN